MRYDLPERVIRELFSFATKHSVRKIILKKISIHF